MRARECRLYWAPSIIAPSVNVLRRTRRKPSTIRGAAPDVVIGQSTAARAGAHPYRAGEVARSYHSDSVYQRFNSNRNKGLRVGSYSNATFSKTNYLEILPAGVNKAKALAVLTEALGLNLLQVAAIGDAANDLEMLSEVGLSIAMGNASSEVKLIADWVVGTNDEAGVAQAAQRLLDGALGLPN